MLQIPWFVRWGIDLSLFALPVYLISTYPRTVFHFQNNKKRIQRRKSLDEVKVREDSQMTFAEVQELRSSLQFKDTM